MKFNLDNEQFNVEDTLEKITIADSFVVRDNKIGSGNGEAKLYVGNDNDNLRAFFGGSGFNNKVFLLKKDLIKYLEDTKEEYLNPCQNYINKEKLPQLFSDRLNLISNLPNIISFNIFEKTNIRGPRVYVNSDDNFYSLIRELSLPNISYLSIVKLRGRFDEELFYLRLFADYFGDFEHPNTKKTQNEELEKIVDPQEKEIIAKARKGQGKYRKELLKLCPVCPITGITDDRLLRASHIKPWSKSNNFEKIDPFNGFMLTPTYDHLFDKGFISFDNNRNILLSPFLSKMTYSMLSLSDRKIYSQLPIDGREVYLDFHRENIFKN